MRNAKSLEGCSARTCDPSRRPLRGLLRARDCCFVRASAPRRFAARGWERAFRDAPAPYGRCAKKFDRVQSVPKRGCRSRRHPEAWSNPRILGFLDQDAIESDGLGSRSGSFFSLWTGEERRPATRCLSMDGGRHPGWSRPPPAPHDPRSAPFVGGSGRDIGICSGCVKAGGWGGRSPFRTLLGDNRCVQFTL